jgi:hypothetical protein
LIDWCLKPTLAIFQLYRGECTRKRHERNIRQTNINIF